VSAMRDAIMAYSSVASLSNLDKDTRVHRKEVSGQFESTPSRTPIHTTSSAHPVWDWKYKNKEIIVRTGDNTRWNQSARVRVDEGGAFSSNVVQPYLKDVLKENLAEFIRKWMEQWSRETAAHSSMLRRKQHPAYDLIVKSGISAVPLLLDAIQSAPDFWFPLLRDITGVNPVHPDHRGDYQRMADDWLSWGQKNDLIP